MRTMSIRILALSVLSLSLLGCAKQRTPEEAARELVRVSGVESQMAAMEDVVANSMSREDGLAFRGVFNSKEMIERMIPVYIKHFTVDEMDRAIEFYQSDAGRKFVAAAPDLTREGAAIGQQYVEEKMAAMRQATGAP